MSLSMAFLATGDAAIKVMSDSYERSVFMVFAGVGLTLICATVSVFTKDNLWDKRALSGAPLLRSFGEIASATTVMMALAYVPFIIVTFLLQAIPLIVTLGAVLFLGEKVGIRRWGAIIAGLIGVFIILRPGGQSFSPEWLLALAAATSLAARDLCSRAVPRDLSTIQISAWGAIAVGIAGVVTHLLNGSPLPTISPSDYPAFGLMLFAWAGGMFAVTEAMRMGDVGTIAPFRYMRLPFGLLIGLLYFGEKIDVWMIAGVAVIVASGLFVLHREFSDRKRSA